MFFCFFLFLGKQCCLSNEQFSHMTVNVLISAKGSLQKEHEITKTIENSMLSKISGLYKNVSPTPFLFFLNFPSPLIWFRYYYPTLRGAGRNCIAHTALRPNLSSRLKSRPKFWSLWMFCLSGLFIINPIPLDLATPSWESAGRSWSRPGTSPSPSSPLR